MRSDVRSAVQVTRSGNVRTVSQDCEAGMRAAAPVIQARFAADEFQDITGLFRANRIKLTRQRLALGRLVFGRGDRHLTAEMLYGEARAAKIDVSVATVYNVLRLFTDARLLRPIGVDGSKIYFDTNVVEHSHFLVEDSHELIDVAEPSTIVGEGLVVPAAFEINRIDVVLRLRRKTVRFEHRIGLDASGLQLKT